VTKLSTRRVSLLSLGAIVVLSTVFTATASADPVVSGSAATTQTSSGQPKGTEGEVKMILVPDGRVAPQAIVDPQCYLRPGNTYLRTSANKGAVGFKPTVSCAVPVTSISMSAQMHKYHFYGLLTEPVGPVFNNNNVGQSSLTNTSIQVTCTNNKSTKWYGQVSSSSVYNGLTYTALTSTPDATLNCGT
jgi:hypothetical protein